MDSDRELLEMAAKAAGIALLDWRDDWAYGDSKKGGAAYRMTDRELWNPLRFDGDALRLAVKLLLRIEHGPGPAVYVGTSGDDGEDLACEVWHLKGPLIEAAARRAIVRAAAELGRRG